MAWAPWTDRSANGMESMNMEPPDDDALNVRIIFSSTRFQRAALSPFFFFSNPLKTEALLKIKDSVFISFCCSLCLPQIYIFPCLSPPLFSGVAKKCLVLSLSFSLTHFGEFLSLSLFFVVSRENTRRSWGGGGGERQVES